MQYNESQIQDSKKLQEFWYINTFVCHYSFCISYLTNFHFIFSNFGKNDKQSPVNDTYQELLSMTTKLNWQKYY